MEEQAQQLFVDQGYIRCISDLSSDQLTEIDTFLQSLLNTNSELLEKTHFFHQRYENLYLKKHQNESLQQLMSEALQLCADMLGTRIEKLSISYWFNLMQPGHVTTMHRHDDWDELISGVVYLTVPKNSGDLILQLKGEEKSVEPKTGHFIFFDPRTPHAVSENLAQSHRLSIGLNIGLKAGLKYQ